MIWIFVDVVDVAVHRHLLIFYSRVKKHLKDVSCWMNHFGDFVLKVMMTMTMKDSCC